jgi:hypothetical protein
MRATIEAWNGALLDVLLPPGEPGRVVLLGCDDEALVQAGRRLGIDTGAEQELLGALAALAPLRAETGLLPALQQLRHPPADFAVLSLCVLAASRMSPDEHGTSHAYYARLADLLRIPLRDRHPRVAGMELVPDRFEALADWLAGAEQGRRGRLCLSEHPHYKLIWSPISQTLLRRVDRDRLGGFFARHAQALDAGRDPLRLLARSPARHDLTRRAQEALASEELVPALRASLRAAYAAWDGTIPDERGGRVQAGALRLGYTPGRLTLNLSLPRESGEQRLRGPDGGALTLNAPAGECQLPLAWLSRAREGPLDIERLPGLERVRALSGPTLLFEAGERGFFEVDAAGEQELIVLSCEPELTRSHWGSRVARCELPTGWRLIFEVGAEELRPELRRPPRAARPGADVWLTGGLSLEDSGVFLVGRGPQLEGELAEPALADLVGPDGGRRLVGELIPGEPLALPASASGSYLVEVSGDELRFELTSRGLREGIGAYGHHPQSQALRRSGAVDEETARLHAPAGPRVCGAGVDGAGMRGWRAPVCVRAQALVHVVDVDGGVHTQAPPIHPGWARQAGLPAGGLWELPGGERAVFVCVGSREHARVLALRDEQIEPNDELLDLVERFAEAPVIAPRAPGAVERWRRLVELALEDQEAPAGA